MLQAITAGLGAAGSIMGSISNNQHVMEQLRLNATRERENQDWFNRRYNEDATQRADAQRLLTRTEEAIRRRNRAAAGRAAVMGATDESVAAEREANNQALADATAQIAAEGEKRKGAIEQQYLAKKDQLNDAKAALKAQQQSGLDILGGAIGGAANGLGLGLG